MLIIRRKKQQEVWIETPEGVIRIKVLSVGSRAVELGIAAPLAFRISRMDESPSGKQKEYRNGSLS